MRVARRARPAAGRDRPTSTTCAARTTRHHAALLCVQTKSTLEQPKLRFDTNEFFLKSPAEMAESFAALAGVGAETTLEIAERCEVELELGKLLLPRFPTPDGEEPARDASRGSPTRACARRYGDPPPAEALERLEFELGVIGEMGFESYFLIVWDFVRFAKDNGIAVGPGRGSAAGSIVAYCLNITDLDPLANELLFERFLNPARKSMPDIDIDFSVRGRERVIRYVAEKYGRESVAQIITFGKMAPRAATRDAARVLGFDYATGDRIAKLIPEPIMGRSPSFDECLKPGQELAAAYDSDADARQIVDVARGLEGIVRNNSIHAAAVVIADRPLARDRPAAARRGPRRAGREAATNGKPERSYKIVTQYSMGPIEEIGLLKMDFLGLRNLDVIEDAVDDHRALARGRGRHGVDPARRREDLRDARPRRLGRRLPARVRGHARGAASRSGRPSSTTSSRSAPSTGPGAMRFIDDYARGKRDPASVRYPDPRLRPITEATYGCCIYQEQLMEIAKQHGRLHPRRGRRPAQGGRQEEARPDGDDGGQVHRRAAPNRAPTPAVAKDLWSLMTAAADYSLQQVPRRLLRADLLPDRLPEGQLPGRVHGGGDLLGDVDQGQGPVLRQPLRGDGDRGAAARRQLLRPRLRGQPASRSASGSTRSRTSATRRSRRSSRRASGRPVRLDLGLLRAGRRAGGQQAGDRVPGQVRRARLDRRDAARGCSRCSPQAQAGGQQVPGGRAPRPGLDLRPRRRRRRPAQRPASAARRASALDPDGGVRPARAAARSRRRRSAPSSRRTRSARSATRCGRGSTARSPTWPRRTDGAWVTVGGIVSEAKRVRTRSGAYVMFATLDDLEGQGRAVRPRRRRRGGRGRSSSTGWSWSAAGSTTRGGGEIEPRGRRGRGVRARRGRGGRGAGQGARRAIRTGSCCSVGAAEFGAAAGRGAEVAVRVTSRASRGPARDGDPRGRRGGCGSGTSTGSRPPPALRAELDQLLGPRALAA